MAPLKTPKLEAQKPDAPSAVAFVGAVEGNLLVTLTDDKGQEVARKFVKRSGSCRKDAATVAAILAAWDSGLALDDAVPPLVLAPSLRPGLGRPPPTAEIPRVDVRATGEPALAAATPSRWLPVVGVGLLGSYQGRDVAPVASLDLRMRSEPDQLGLRLSFAWTGRHRQPLGSGTVVWTRADAGAGGTYRVSLGRTTVDLDLDLVVAFLFVGGEGFSGQRSSQTSEVGGRAGARVSRGRARLAPWFELAASGWVGSQAIEVTGLSEQVHLPRAELTAGIGCHFDAGL